MSSMYTDLVIDYYKHPVNKAELAEFDAEDHQVNPTCGDEVTLRVRLDGDRIEEIGWVGEGCSISQASTSIMTDLVGGKTTGDALALERTFSEFLKSRGEEDLSDEDTERLGDAVIFTMVARNPGRVKCAALGWKALQGVLAKASAGEGNTT